MTTPKILIVDDEAETRKTLSDYLFSRIQCAILQASNGYEAIEQLKSQPIDLILLDITMPGISGTEVIQKAREIRKDAEIIVITKWDSTDVSKQVKESGADYIPKPFSLKVVRAKIEEKLQAMGKFTGKQVG